MAARTPHPGATLITSAAAARSADVDRRTRSYLITMGVRSVCFLAFLVVPGWWKVAALALAALLPAFAVLFANAASHHGAAPVGNDAEPSERIAIAPGEVIRGSLEEDE